MTAAAGQGRWRRDRGGGAGQGGAGNGGKPSPGEGASIDQASDPLGKGLVRIGADSLLGMSMTP